MSDERPTSVQLRETQAALAASQADLTRVEQDRAEAIEQRDEAREELYHLRAVVDERPCGWCAGIGVAPEELFGRDSDGAPMVDGPQPCPEGCEVVAWLQAERNDAADAERVRDLARAELASARQELDQLRAQLTDQERS